MGRIMAMRNPIPEHIDYKLVTSALIMLLSVSILNMCRRTQLLGQMLTILISMVMQIFRFIVTFGLGFIIYFLIWDFLDTEITFNHNTPMDIAKKLFFAFNDESIIRQFDTLLGFSFASSFIFLFQVSLVAFLIAMFINRHRTLSKNIDAVRRFDTISLKNSSRYDKTYGGVTITFFPINILMLPFLLPVVLFKNPRLSEFVLKMQYGFMMFLYFLVSFIFAFPLSILLYIKALINSIYILKQNLKEENKWPLIRQVAICVFASPFIILFSLFIDLTTVPNKLMQPYEQLEHKY
mmetsp:Transcript_12415/g.19423  ORF Transcript_12415/g.19423 Transcript_12415/m.19423 type:complete len:294 (+) Transcript_12415:896-1777(+)